MVYVIIAIVAFLILKKLFSSILSGAGAFFKALFFGPQVNSVVTIILIACFLIADVTLFSESLRPLFKVLWVLSILDCIRDILLADSYYARYGVDSLYATKSVLSIFTLGLVRGVFLFVVGPLLRRAVARELRETVDSGRLVSPYYGNGLSAEEYYYDRELEKLVQSGKLVSNEDTLRRELAISEERLEKLSPKKIKDKVVDAVAGEEEAKRLRANAEKQLPNIRAARAYLTQSAIDRLGATAAEALKTKSALSAGEIVQLDQLASFRSPQTVDRWRLQMFLIQALAPLVEDGTLVEDRLSDKDPLDNHVYRHAQSEMVKVIDSRLEDDDLGEMG